MSKLLSSGAHDLVIREYTPACDWSEDSVNQALSQCIANDDLLGAESLFSRINQEHIVFFGYDFRKTPEHATVPAVGIEHKIAVTCAAAFKAIQEIRQNRQ